MEPRRRRARYQVTEKSNWLATMRHMGSGQACRPTLRSRNQEQRTWLGNEVQQRVIQLGRTPIVELRHQTEGHARFAGQMLK